MLISSSFADAETVELRSKAAAKYFVFLIVTSLKVSLLDPTIPAVQRPDFTGRSHGH